MLPSNLRLPIYVIRENFHLSCRGSYKAQEGRGFFLFSRSRAGGGVVVSPGKFLKKMMQMVHSEPFCRLIVNIFF